MRRAISIGLVCLVFAVVGVTVHGVQTSMDAVTKQTQTLTQDTKTAVPKSPNLYTSSSKDKRPDDAPTKGKDTQSAGSQSDNSDSSYQGPTTTVLPSVAVPPGMGIPIGGGLSIVVTP